MATEQDMGNLFAERQLSAPAKFAEICSAFQTSGLECDSKDAAFCLHWAVNQLASMWVLPPSPPCSLPSSRKVGHKEARKELDALADAAEALKARLEALSGTSIDALTNQETRPQAMLWIDKTSSDLSELAIGARDADVSNARGRGREKNKRASLAAGFVIDAVERISRCDADRPANISEKQANDKPRGLEPLVQNIFEVLHIKGNPKAAIEAALKERRNQGQQNPPGGLGDKPYGRSSRPHLQGKEMFDRLKRKELARLSPAFWKNKNTSPNNY
jgi:hypothetical protein